ncbi:PREDICTED: double-stranded RNA-specific editase B2-like [Cyprinodon variegatus]|uniref:double-stranded RNA-specific editase B2-like n=1 Tax=Cyprinodon variegatus TaxID=28743 RepID=UPI000742B6E7|nr:PREDICTED: double-stranded RNA-specific editase B2-like [Cyprinodon variegatus]
MAPVQGMCSRNMERSDGDVHRRSKRKRRRRRRSKGKGWSEVISAFSKPLTHCDNDVTSAEVATRSSWTSLDVKENQNVKIIRYSEVLRKFHPTVICAPSPKQSQMVLQRDQQFSDGKHPLCFKKLSCCQRSVWTVSPKNAMEQLNELHPGLQYDILSKSGPLHAPVFSVGVKVNGFEFEGQGSTKKQAKIKAAELALQSLVQFPNASQTQSTMENFDFTADFFTEFEPSLTDNCKLLHCSGATMQVLSNISKRRNTHSFTLDLISSTNPNRQSFPLKHQSPVALLNELLPGLRYMCQVERIHGTPLKNFIMMVRLEGKVFEGCGHSKRQAKARAAAAALQSLYNVSLGPERKLLNSQGSRTKHHLPQFFAESIYHMVREKYSQLTDGGPSSSHGRHKVLAGIVMTRGFDLRSAQVVSLATGTKCLDSMTAKDEGCTLRDCHAEVLSRRALVRFFFTQLELALCEREEGEDQSIFVADKDSTYHFQLREGVRFHMYVSMSPCGDARLNSPYETKPAYPSRKFRCRLRVKVNGGEGTLPVVSQSTHQKWDSVVLGQPVHMASVSCTDKIAKWSVVGLQGALLTRLVKPIYLHSLTVGTLSHTGHLGRAITCRLAAVRHLFSFYRQQELLLGCLSSREVYTAGKASNVCMNWSYGEGVLEEVSTTTGRRKVSGTPSQICRNSLFSYWLKLDNKCSGYANLFCSSTTEPACSHLNVLPGLFLA